MPSETLPPEVLLRFSCRPHDEEMIAHALREATGQPVHAHEESVYGRDYSDANAVESVTGLLSRVVLELRVPAERTAELVAAVGALDRVGPVRWVALPIFEAGRIV